MKTSIHVRIRKGDEVFLVERLPWLFRCIGIVKLKLSEIVVSYSIDLEETNLGFVPSLLNIPFYLLKKFNFERSLSFCCLELDSKYCISIE